MCTTTAAAAAAKTELHVMRPLHAARVNQHQRSGMALTPGKIVADTLSGFECQNQQLGAQVDMCVRVCASFLWSADGCDWGSQHSGRRSCSCGQGGWGCPCSLPAIIASLYDKGKGRRGGLPLRALPVCCEQMGVLGAFEPAPHASGKTAAHEQGGRPCMHVRAMHMHMCQISMNNCHGLCCCSCSHRP